LMILIWERCQNPKTQSKTYRRVIQVENKIQMGTYDFGIRNHRVVHALAFWSASSFEHKICDCWPYSNIKTIQG
jgi:hypothetical protein